MRNSFVFHLEWMDLFEEAELNNDEIAFMLVQINSYVKGEEVRFEDRTMKAVWTSVKRLLDADIAAYNERCEKNRDNVRKRWNKDDTNVYERIPSNTNVYERIPSNTNVYDSIRTDTNGYDSIRTDTNGYEPIRTDTKNTDTDTDTYTDTEYDTDTDYNSTSNTLSMTDSYIYNNNIYNNNPTKQSVLSYFTSQSQSAKEAEKFYDYYSAKDWKIDGKPIISWHNVANRWISNIRSPAKTKAHNFTQRSYTKEQDQMLSRKLFGY